MKRLVLVVKGEVQGVGFRYRTSQLARSLGVKGFARNRLDGSVEIVAEADENALENFEAQIRKGFFVRETLRKEELATGEFASFEVRPTQ